MDNLVLIVTEKAIVQYKDVEVERDDDNYLVVYRKSGPDNKRKRIIAQFNEWHWYGSKDEINAIEILENVEERLEEIGE